LKFGGTNPLTPDREMFGLFATPGMKSLGWVMHLAALRSGVASAQQDVGRLLSDLSN
jgi:hypothetical protein